MYAFRLLILFQQMFDGRRGPIAYLYLKYTVDTAKPKA